MVAMVVFLSVVGPRPSPPRWRSLARGAIGPQPSGPEHRGGRWQTAFLSREECRRPAAGEKSRPSRCGKAVEAQAVPRASIRPFEAASDAPVNELMETTMTAATF